MDNKEEKNKPEIKEEIFELVCKNPWCKARFFIKESLLPKYVTGVCDKCNDLDYNMSGGVTWETHKYDGPRFDGKAHPINIRVSNYK